MKEKDENFPNFEEIISLLPGNVYWKNREGVYLGCNDNMARIVKLKSRHNVVGKTLYDFSSKVIADRIHKIDKDIMETGEAYCTEEKAFDLQGNPAIYLSHKVPLRNSKNEVIGLLGISVDITDRKRYENTLKRAKINNEYPDLEEIIGLLPGNIYWKNREGVYLGCNDNNAKILNLKSRHDFVGKTLYDIAPKAIADDVTDIDESIMQSGREHSVEEDAFDENGNPATYFTRKVPLKNDDDKVIGLAGISIDITERKRYEEELKLAKEKAELANKTKSEFIMNMSHDIRTPFSGILGLSQFLAEKETDPEKKEILDCVVESSKSLLDVLNEVIYLATFDQQARPTHRQFDLKVLMETIYKIMHPEAKRKNLAFKLKIKADTPRRVEGDEFGLKRILLNLVGNAVKFTDSGQVNILVNLVEKTQNNALIKITVEDTGIGLPEDKFDVIFEQFSRLSPAHKGKYQGTGLGLWLVKQLVQRMHGEIQVESVLGEGSRFITVVPFQEQSQ